MAIRWILAFLLLEWMAGPLAAGAELGAGNLLLIRVGIFAAFIIGGLAVIATRLGNRRSDLDDSTR